MTVTEHEYTPIQAATILAIARKYASWNPTVRQSSSGRVSVSLRRHGRCHGNGAIYFVKRDGEVYLLSGQRRKPSWPVETAARLILEGPA
jgi:hypothetical protein